MEPEELYRKLKTYFPINSDLMRHLKNDACWEYIITEHSTNEENTKIHYFLYKKDENHLEMTKINPGIKPDLILYFTEKAILSLIYGNPNADEYFARYHNLMYKHQSTMQIDNKINKPRLKLFKLGYQKWQKDFKF